MRIAKVLIRVLKAILFVVEYINDNKTQEPRSVCTDTICIQIFLYFVFQSLNKYLYFILKLVYLHSIDLIIEKNIFFFFNFLLFNVLS